MNKTIDSNSRSNILLFPSMCMYLFVFHLSLTIEGMTKKCKYIHCSGSFQSSNFIIWAVLSKVCNASSFLFFCFSIELWLIVAKTTSFETVGYVVSSEAKQDQPLIIVFLQTFPSALSKGQNIARRNLNKRTEDWAGICSVSQRLALVIVVIGMAFCPHPEMLMCQSYCNNSLYYVLKLFLSVLPVL